MTINTKTIRTAVIAASAAAAAAFSSDWPSWHGDDRTNKSKETGLLKEWPKDGPKLLWTAKGLGDGYSGVTVSNGTIYSAGTKNKGSFVYAFDKSGKLLWEKQLSKAYEAARAMFRQYEGSRATPTIDGNNLFHLTDAGLLVALDAKTGASRWSLSLTEKYGTDAQKFGYSESPLVVGDKLYIAPYGSKVTVICLDKNTGKVLWESGYITTDEKGYASHILIEHSGHKQLIAFTSDFLYSIDAENGKTLWTMPFKNNRTNNCTDAVYSDGHLFVSSGYGRGYMLVKLGAKDGKPTAEIVYDNDKKSMDNIHGGLIFHNGYIYGSGHDHKGWFCIDFQTGKQVWNTPGKGSLTFADGMLYFYDESGKTSLVKPTADKFAEVGHFQAPSGGKGAHWAHPVVSGGVLYLRHADNLYAYDIKAR
jgi:outer membrane protein assembly factor BamB